MKKLFVCCALLALLLCACGAPGAAETTTAFDLAAIGDGPVAFDLTDLNDLLSPAQRAALETALRAELEARGYPPESIVLQFDEPDPGSVKLPFTNTGGSLANLDTDKLAEHIAGQIAKKVGVTETQAEAATSTSTTITTITTTTKAAETTVATATQKSTTTKAPTAKYTPPNILSISDNDVLTPTKFAAMGGYSASGYNDNGTYDNPRYMCIEVATPYGDVRCVKRPYEGKNELIMDFYVKNSNNQWELRQVGVKDLPGSDGLCYINLVGDKNNTFSFPGESNLYYRDAHVFAFVGKQGDGANRRFEYDGNQGALKGDTNMAYVFAEELF